MRVVVPYTDLHADADAALTAYAPDAERVDVSGSVEAYWRLLRELWRAREDFAVIEHDVVITEGTIEGFEACSEPWCACADPTLGPAQLQCTRFRASLMDALPDALELPGWMRHWVHQDQSLLPKLGDAGFRCHRHGQATKHLRRAIDCAWSQAGFYAWLAQFGTADADAIVAELEPGLERDRLLLAKLVAPLVKFCPELHRLAAGDADERERAIFVSSAAESLRTDSTGSRESSRDSDQAEASL